MLMNDISAMYYGLCLLMFLEILGPQMPPPPHEGLPSLLLYPIRMDTFLCDIFVSIYLFTLQLQQIGPATVRFLLHTQGETTHSCREHTRLWRGRLSPSPNPRSIWPGYIPPTKSPISARLLGSFFHSIFFSHYNTWHHSLLLPDCGIKSVHYC